MLDLEPLPLVLGQLLVVRHFHHQVTDFASELILQLAVSRPGVFDGIVQDGRDERREVGYSSLGGEQIGDGDRVIDVG